MRRATAATAGAATLTGVWVAGTGWLVARTGWHTGTGVLAGALAVPLVLWWAWLATRLDAWAARRRARTRRLGRE